MVDVSSKATSKRRAQASAFVLLVPAVLDALPSNPKGDPLEVARLAGIMLPPPTPFKLFVLAAAAFEMNFWHFLLAIFSGRFVRFLILSLLTIKFGPAIAGYSGKFLGEHIFWVLGVTFEIVAIWWLVRRVKSKRKNSSHSQENQS